MDARLAALCFREAPVVQEQPSPLMVWQGILVARHFWIFFTQVCRC